MKKYKIFSLVVSVCCFLFAAISAQAGGIDKSWSYKGWKQHHPHQGNNIISSIGTQYFFAPADPVILKISKMPSKPKKAKTVKPVKLAKAKTISQQKPAVETLPDSIPPFMEPFVVAEDKKDANKMKMSYSLGKDMDEDGIADENDLCLNTPQVDMVNKQGCWVLGKIYFLFGKATLQKKFTSKLDNMISYLKAHPEYKIELGGHTDNIGANSINNKIAAKRAIAVMNYFIKKGIARERLSNVSFGLSRPDTDNSTVVKRYYNRRVEVHPFKPNNT
ncbi:MAG: OmpA family protein [Magnetococcales bacterium]|nr:OmpA family protein [Magnetococcales bacterium]